MQKGYPLKTIKIEATKRAFASNSDSLGSNRVFFYEIALQSTVDKYKAIWKNIKVKEHHRYTKISCYYANQELSEIRLQNKFQSVSTFRLHE